MPPTTSVPPNTNGISDLISIDPANAVIALLSLAVAIIAIIFAVKADRKANRASIKANQIGEMQRIDGLMPNISIPAFKSFGSLFTQHYPHLNITLVSDLPNDPNKYDLNGGSIITKDELEWILKVKISIANSSSNSASLSIVIEGIDNKEITISGSANSTVSFDIKQRITSFQMAQSLINNKLSLSYKITCQAIGTESYDEISGKFPVVYNADFNAQTLSDIIFESSRKREYKYDI